LMIGQVGYLYTLPALEKIAGRLEAHLSGQKAMNFINQSSSHETELLPIVKEAINSLQSQ
jgi:hypothetical protein